MIKIPGVLGTENNKIYVGFDLGNDFSRISYCTERGEVETFSTVTGSEQYSIPTALCKREGVNQWFCGREALRYFQEQGGFLSLSLLNQALLGDPVEIDNNFYQPVSLLTLYMKRCLAMLSQDRVEGITVTVESLDQRYLDVLKEAVDGLKLKTDKIFFQSRVESFYNYMIRQPGELWHKGALLMELEEDTLRIYSMEANLRTTPVVVYIGESSQPFACEPRSNTSDLEYELQQKDRAFLNICKDVLGQTQAGSIFLLGDQFSNQWMKESLKYLCSRFRVFQGNNLYSKGACYGLMDRLNETPVGRGHVFLGNDKLRSNVGMQILRQGEDTYFALLDAGVNWFEASSDFDFYLQEGDTLSFKISNLVKGTNSEARMKLEDFSGELTRFHAKIYLTDDTHMAVELEELGFGAFRPASHRMWKEQLVL